MRRVVIESPYAGDVGRNVAFCRAVCRYASLHGYAPYASHLIFTQFLDDDVPTERRLGIDGGIAWADAADEVWFCLREGEIASRGMTYAQDRHAQSRRRMQYIRWTQDGQPLTSICEICQKETPFTMTAEGVAPCGSCTLSIVCS